MNAKRGSEAQKRGDASLYHSDQPSASAACATEGSIHSGFNLSLELSHSVMRRLLLPIFENDLLAEAEVGKASGSPTSGGGRASGSHTELKIRLDLLEDQPYEPDSLVERWTGAPPRFKVCLGNQLAAQANTAAATINGWVRRGLLHTAPNTVSRLLVEAPLAAILAGNGWQVVHAATVVGSAGAVVIRGGADSGKSTLAAAAWKAGLQVLGDESILVERSDYDEVLTAVREVLVHPVIAEKLTLSGEPSVTAAGKAKVRIALEPIAACQRRTRHAATILIGTRDRPRTARLTPLGPEQLIAGFPAGAIPQESWYHSSVALVQAWSRRPAYRLDGSADLETSVALVGALCRGELR